MSLLSWQMIWAIVTCKRTVTVPVSSEDRGNMLVNVTDMKGSTVLTRTVAVAAKFTLDVSTLPNGT
jgi:hypothetical protein